MGNRICYPLTQIPERLAGTVTAPQGGLKAGDIVIAYVLDDKVINNNTQYEATLPTSVLLREEAPAIVVSSGNFEELEDGRMPIGNADYTTYEYQEGETVPVLFLEPGVIFYLSDDCLEDSPIKGQVLYGQNNSYTLTFGDTMPNNILTGIEVLSKKDFRLGGVFGGDYASGNVCKVYAYNKLSPLYTVGFDTDGGSEVPSQRVEAGEKVKIPVPSPTKVGHTFYNWYKNSEKTILFDFYSEEVNSNMTIYADWTLNSYTVQFNTEGGSTVANQTVEYGKKATEPTPPTKENYTFDGWYTTETYQTEFDFDTMVITMNTTLYAKWTN